MCKWTFSPWFGAFFLKKKKMLSWIDLTTFVVLNRLNDRQWSTARVFAPNDECCKVMFCFYRKSCVLFSPKLLNSECVLPLSIAVTLSTVLVLPCSLMWLHTEYWVVYLLLCIKAVRYKLFYCFLVLFGHFCSCALMLGFFFWLFF